MTAPGRSVPLSSSSIRNGDPRAPRLGKISDDMATAFVAIMPSQKKAIARAAGHA